MKIIKTSILMGAVLLASLNLVQAQEQPAQPDSIVQITAEAEGLPLADPTTLPLVSPCWWTVYPNGGPVPAPCPPFDLTLPMYEMADGSFLVDETGGVTSTNSAVLDRQGNAIADLIEQVEETQYEHNMARAFGMDDFSPNVDGSGDGGGYSPGVGGINYTNLWIAQWSMVSGNVTGIASNTLADVSYEILTNGDLTTTNWGSTGLFILGSELTNWTALPLMSVSSTNNCFYRLRSWASSDATGLPDWWELEYFGATGIEPNAQDSAGDGWTIYQKFKLGVNPNVFYTPPAPQVAGSLNSNFTAIIRWLPSPGQVTGYLIEKYDYSGVPTTADFSVSSNTLSFEDDLSSDYDVNDLGLDGPDSEFASYSVRAEYVGGNSAPGSAILPGNGIAYTPVSVINANLVNGPNGRLYYTFQGLPSDTAFVRICRVEQSQPSVFIEYDYDDIIDSIISSPFTNGYFLIPVADITNGVCQLPDSQTSPFFNENYAAQIIHSNGLCSAWSSFNWPAFSAYASSLPFIDFRRQIKDNLSFILRAAPPSQPFGFVTLPYNDTISNTNNYAYAGIYDPQLVSYVSPYLDVFKPESDNFIYRNFVYDRSRIDANGHLNTGVYLGSPAVLTNETDYLYNFDLVGFLEGTDETVPSSYLSAVETQFLIQDDTSGGPMSGNTFQTGIKNYYGLSYKEVQVTYVTNDEVHSDTLYPGQGAPSMDLSSLFFQTVQPGYQLADYYFARVGFDPQPESFVFSTTNTTPATFIGVGNSMTMAAYEMLAVTNAYAGTYAYLGQYFERACTMDGGNVTSTNAGILSPYGNFFATAPGQVALVTMPDIDTGQRGTDIVNCVSLALDGNHDGTIDTSFTSPDSTSVVKPYIFWANNNYDRNVLDADDNTFYDDDVKVQDSPGTPDQDTPDCNFLDGAGHRAIPSGRDLQDFARLWICGINSNLVSNLPAGSTVTLNWGDVGSPSAGNPTIDLFAAADSDGGIGYLTNSVTSDLQTENFLCPYIGRLGPGSNIVLNAGTFANNWAGNHFIFCGVGFGTGGLILTITDAIGNTLVKTTAYLKILDIKQMYERWTVGELGDDAPLTNAVLAADDDLPTGLPAFQYPAPQNTNTPYILYVHGWNMETWEKDRFAESAFKRFYWQGYHGRFGSFRWPTFNGFTGSTWQTLTDPRNFDNSEFIAWQSATGLVNTLAQLNTEYSGHGYVLAHSMGNVVTGEALQLAAENGYGRVVNTYVASQAAVPAHDYDATVTSPYLLQFTFTYPSGALNLLGSRNYGPTTPNIYGNFLTNNVAGAGRRISFFNTNDFALSMPRWGFDQILKPDTLPVGTFVYAGSISDPPPWNNFAFLPIGGGSVTLDIVGSKHDRCEVMAYAAEPRSTALGATPNVLNISASLDLTTIWPVDSSGHNYGNHFWHSAEFRGDYWQQQSYWHNLLFSSVGFNISSP